MRIGKQDQAFTAIAIGYREAAQAGDSALHAREDEQRTRRPLGEFVFAGNFGDPAGF